MSFTDNPRDGDWMSQLNQSATAETSNTPYRSGTLGSNRPGMSASAPGWGQTNLNDATMTWSDQQLDGSQLVATCGSQHDQQAVQHTQGGSNTPSTQQGSLMNHPALPDMPGHLSQAAPSASSGPVTALNHIPNDLQITPGEDSSSVSRKRTEEKYSDRFGPFWTKVVKFGKLNTQTFYKGSYAQLNRDYPSLRRVIHHDFLKEKARLDAELITQQPRAQTAEMNYQYTHSQSLASSPSNSVGPQEYRPEAVQQPQYRLPGTAHTFGSADGLDQSARQLVALVPKAIAAKPHRNPPCIKCHRDVIPNGKNDGKRCTRCFNEAKREGEQQLNQYQNGNPSSISHTTSGDRNGQIAGASQQITDFGALQSFIAQNPALDFVEPSISSATSMAPRIVSGEAMFGGSIPNYQLQLGQNQDQSTVNAKFDLVHKDVQAAREYLDNPPAHLCRQLHLTNDDWLSVKTEKFHDLCQELYEALDHPWASPREKWDEYTVMYYNDSQAKEREAVSRDLSTVEGIFEAKAQVMVAMGEVVRVHEHGIPKSMFQKSKDKKGGGYPPEVEVTCEARARKIIAHVKADKHVAADILQRKNLRVFAVSPDGYAKHKFTNLESNATRSKGKMEKNKVNSEQDVVEDPAKAGPLKRGRKPKTERASVASPATASHPPVTNSPFSGFQYNMNKPAIPVTAIPDGQPTAISTGSYDGQLVFSQSMRYGHYTSPYRMQLARPQGPSYSPASPAYRLTHSEILDPNVVSSELRSVQQQTRPAASFPAAQYTMANIPQVADVAPAFNMTAFPQDHPQAPPILTISPGSRVSQKRGRDMIDENEEFEVAPKRTKSGEFVHQSGAGRNQEQQVHISAISQTPVKPQNPPADTRGKKRSHSVAEEDVPAKRVRSDIGEEGFNHSDGVAKATDFNVDYGMNPAQQRDWQNFTDSDDWRNYIDFEGGSS